MQVGDEEKTIFKIEFRWYEWFVMTFRLTNDTSTFMPLMNHVLREYTIKKLSHG